jgi:nucleoside-specific outer membrane channel protein Tsx
MKRTLLAACAVAAMLAPATAQERLPDGIVTTGKQRHCASLADPSDQAL